MMAQKWKQRDRRETTVVVQREVMLAGTSGGGGVGEKQSDGMYFMYFEHLYLTVWIWGGVCQKENTQMCLLDVLISGTEWSEWL